MGWWERKFPVFALKAPAPLCPFSTQDTLAVPAFLFFFLLNPGGPGMFPASSHCWPWVPVTKGPLQAWCGHTAEDVAHRQAALKPQLPQLCNHLCSGPLGRARETEVWNGVFSRSPLISSVSSTFCGLRHHTRRPFVGPLHRVIPKAKQRQVQSAVFQCGG